MWIDWMLYGGFAYVQLTSFESWDEELLLGVVSNVPNDFIV
jgi:hypothetical protein